MNSKLPQILFCSCLLILSASGFSQAILEQCFYSIGAGTDFPSNGEVSNSGGADVAYYSGGEWNGSSFGVSSPYDCDNPRAIRISDQNSPSDAVGFRLGGGLTTGSNFNVSLRVMKTAGNFNITVFTGNSGEFYTGTDIDAVQTTSQSGNYTTWQDITINFNVPNASNGHNWIFFRADSGTGLIANLCQNGVSRPEVDLGEDKEICNGETVDLDITNPASFYTWSTGATTAIISVGTEGIYTGTAANSCGSQEDEIEIIVHNEPELNVTADTIVCAGTILTLEAEGWNATYLWNDGTTEETLTVETDGIYSVEITDDCFQITDEVEVSYLDPPVVDLGPDTAVCGGTVDYYVANGGPTSTYQWSNGVESPAISITETGNYSINITNQCGSANDEVFVEFSYHPGDFLPYQKEFCEGKPMTIDLSWIDGTFEWDDGTTDPVYQVPNPGWHFVEIIDDDSCFVAMDTVFVERIFCDCPVHLANSFTPNGDGVNEDYEIIFECPPYDYELTIFDRWGQIMFQSNNPNIAWSGRNKYGDLVSSAVYTYILKYTEVYQGFLKIKKGSVFLMKD